MATTRQDLERMLDRLEDDLPKLMIRYPDADGADFWVAFAARSVAIEGEAHGDDVQSIRERLDRMLNSRGLLTETRTA